MNSENLKYRIIKLYILNALAFGILLGCSALVEFSSEISLFEISQELEPNSGMETEFEKDIEVDDEIKKITDRVAIPLFAYSNTEIYFSGTKPKTFFNRIQLPPPEWYI